MNAPDPAAATRLEVARADFLQELKRLAKVLGRRNVGEALLRYDNGQLRIGIGGAEAGMQAQGQWQGEARVSAAWIRAFAKVPPPDLQWRGHAGHSAVAGHSGCIGCRQE